MSEFGEAGNTIGVLAAKGAVAELAVIGTKVGLQVALVGFTAGSVHAVVVAYTVGVAVVALAFST
jgi:hypothetical protein